MFDIQLLQPFLEELTIAPGQRFSDKSPPPGPTRWQMPGGDGHAWNWLSINLKDEPRSTVTFTRGLSYIASFSFTLVRTDTLRDSGTTPSWGRGWQWKSILTRGRADRIRAWALIWEHTLIFFKKKRLDVLTNYLQIPFSFIVHQPR